MKNSLDLHGVKHQDVPRELDKFLGEHLMGGSAFVIVITGNSDPMKQIVGATLVDYGLTYEEAWGNGGEIAIPLI